MPEPATASRYAQMLALIDALEVEVMEIRKSLHDRRLESVGVVIRSARAAMELAQGSDLGVANLLPSIIASMLHVRCVILDVAEDYGVRARVAGEGLPAA